ncbi:MAG TPA: hypothetical protein PJ982_13785, partial [Lacipirellulaceae bacterium]|nr:hypothetical protein [Lacipirellulaceae bacterium]
MVCKLSTAQLSFRVAHLGLVILLSASRASIATAVEPTKEEIAAKSMWVDRNWRAGHETPPFSFDFQTAARSTFPQSWKRDEIERSVDQNRTELIITWTHEASGLEVRAEAIEYRDFPAIEWTVYFKNNGGKRTPLLQDITGLDLTLTRGDGGEFV